MTATNVSFTCNNKRVTLGSAIVEYAFTNELTTPPLTIPTTGTTNSSTTKISNMLKYVERLVINGYITTGLANQTGPPVERTNAKDVLADLKEMAKRRSVTVMTYDEDSYNVTFEKISCKETAQDLSGEAPSGVMRYDLQISVVVGDLLF